MRTRRKTRGVGASGPTAAPIQIAITSPPDLSAFPAGTPLTFIGAATKSPPASPSQAGTILHALPGSGWTEISPGSDSRPGQWQNEAGDVESWTLYHVTDPEWWGIGSGTTADTVCELYSAKTGQVLPADQDFWVCPGDAFLPSQTGFQPPDLSELIEWYAGQDKIGEGASVTVTLPPGDYLITAGVQSSQSIGTATIQISVQAAAQPAQGGQSPPQQAPNLPATVPNGTSKTNAPLVKSGASSNWLWLLLLILAVVASEKEKRK